MLDVKMIRILDTFGRLVIPKEIRVTCDISSNDAVEFFVDKETGTISLKKYIGQSCKFCQSTEELSYFKDSLICKSCTYMLKIPFIKKQVLQPNATQQEYANMLGYTKIPCKPAHAKNV